jgi:pimeloyl-ACP methyl ester carboxylesterase
MPSIVTEQGMVHYEVVGSGPPVVLIHGWLGSWDTWRSTIETFGNQYRLYAPDLWGFGESGRKRELFAVPDFIRLIPQIMDSLGIMSAPIVGHSMGGTTALGVALDYPDLVRKVAVVGSPINGKSLSFLLKLAGVPFIARIVRASPALFSAGMRLYSYFVSRKEPDLFYQMTVRNTSRTTLESFFTSISSLHQTDLTPRLHEIAMPAMGVYGAKDVIVSPKQNRVFAQYIPHGKVVFIRNAGHFPMLDTPEQFNLALREFLEI